MKQKIESIALISTLFFVLTTLGIKFNTDPELSVGKETNSPQYTKTTFTTRAQKDAGLSSDSTSFSRGLQESWEWYDKCAKRNRLGKLL